MNYVGKITTENMRLIVGNLEW